MPLTLTLTLLTLFQGSPRSRAVLGFDLGHQASLQYPGRPEMPQSIQDAAGAVMEVTRLLCQLTQMMW